MSIRKNTERQIEEVYQRNLHCKESFRSQELYDMCKYCIGYMGKDHDYTECRQMQCFINWLALEYLDWENSYR